MARRIDAALGVVNAPIPTSVGLKASPLTQVQSIHSESYPSDDDLNFLYQASKTCALAGMDLMDTRAHNDLPIFDAAEATLLSQLPNNSIPVFAGVSYSVSDMWPFAKRHEALMARYPANALLAHTDLWEQRAWGNRAGELRAAKRYLNDSPGDPDAWLALGSTVGNVASDLRQRRQAQDVSPSEWSVLNSLYPLEEKADQHAVQLDPLHGHAWYDLASSATFQGDNLAAKLALDRAIALDPDKAEAYGWGLEMDQPKWGVDPANLSNLATTAANYWWTSSSDALDIASELQSAGFTPLYNRVLTQFVTSQLVLVAQHPSDAGMHWDLEKGLAAQNTPESLQEATQEGRIAVKLMPGCPEYHRDLGVVLDTRGLTSGAIAQYRLAIADNPYDSGLHTALAHDLKEISDFPDALSELTVASRLDPSDGATHWTLAELLSKEGKYPQAIPECRAAISRDYFAVEARVQLAWLLDHEKQPQASIQAGLDALHVLTEYTQPQTELDTGVRTTLADDYLQTKEWSASIAQSNAVLAEDSDNAIAYENLAEADYGAGHIAKARTEWQRVVAMGNPALTSVAQKFLAQTESRVAM